MYLSYFLPFKRINKKHIRFFINVTKKKLSNNNRKEIIVLHPTIKKTKKCTNSFDDIIYDAQEALGLARSAGFKIKNGISMPTGGWHLLTPTDHCDEEKQKYINTQSNTKFLKSVECTKEIITNETNMSKNLLHSKNEELIEESGSTKCVDNIKDSSIMNNNNQMNNVYIEEIHKSNNTHDNTYANINKHNIFSEYDKFTEYNTIEKKIAESIIIKLNKIDNKFYFSKGKLNDISLYYLKNPTPYVFINTVLSPEQYRNLDILFNNLLQSYTEELKLNSQKINNDETLTPRTLDKLYHDELDLLIKLKIPDEENQLTLHVKNDNFNEICTYNDKNDNDRNVCFDIYNKFIYEDDECNVDDKYDDINYDINQTEICNVPITTQNELNNKQTNNNNSSSNNNDTLKEQTKRLPLYVEIFDRYSIILHILKSRSKNNLSKLQLELAKAKFILNTYSENNPSRIKYIKYIEKNVLSSCNYDYEKKYEELNTIDINKPNSLNKNAKSYLGFTSNFIKSSESYKEYENRIITSFYTKLKKELIKCKNNYLLQQNARKHKALIAVVGYTNVGKTKLVNYLTNSKLKTKNQLFQTLDNAYKNLKINDSHSIILIDSIGFIKNVPFSLYESFKISLEAIKNADLIIHVLDVSHSYREQHKTYVLNTLKQIGISNDFIENKIIEVWNKIDKLTEQQTYFLYKNKPTHVLPISAKYGINCDTLLKIIKNLTNQIKDVQIMTLKFATKE
uniref:GTP-binding protein n=1 Tax=Piliocolobus tephrosceles TaxID=591936 RepID=A0A8C9GXB9_9PRIM